MAKPIKHFTSEEQFIKCCKYWQHKLFLDNWFIKFVLTTEELHLGDELAEGLCEFSFNNKEAVITIYNGDKVLNESIVVDSISELAVVHELLHLKNEYFSDKDITGEDSNTFHKYIFHQGVETMAKTLLMVKYNLDYDYFYRA